MDVSMTVNGERVTHDVEPRQLLVHFIRDTPGLTGTHWGCDTSNCGACVVLMDGDTFVDAGIGLSAVGPVTIELTRAEELLRGATPSDELFAQAAAIAAEDCAPIPDTRGPVDYKRHLAGVLTKRALRRATARALQQEA
jgi:CO/xanthine dehydrogenase FAD-binding subunit